MKELIFEELNLEQKLGMVYTALWSPAAPAETNEKWILNMIKKRALGAVWLQQNATDDIEGIIKKIKEAADYPVLIFTDAECGIDEFKIGMHNALGCTNSEEHAYAFGKAVGVTARKKGYNVVCNPVIDLSISGGQRSMGSDKEKVARLAAAEIRGMHDGGVLSVCKHYPGNSLTCEDKDTHAEEVEFPETKKELVKTSLYPYIKLNEQGLLDGIMTGHNRFPNIDPVFPTSFSKEIINVIREQGFKGFTVTDALCMSGIVNTYGYEKSMGLSIAAGNTFALPYGSGVETKYNELKTAYENGVFTDIQLDAAVKIVIETQKKIMQLKQNSEITENEKNLVKSINKDAVFAKTDDGVPTSISRDGKHYFILMVRNETDIANDSKIEVDTFTNGWYFPQKITKRLKELFPYSIVRTVYEFPNPSQNHKILSELPILEVDDVIFLSFSEFLAYIGIEALTKRTIRFLEILQKKNLVSTLIHFGNPVVLEPLPHFKRIIVGGCSEESVNTCLDVLAGNSTAKGTLTYDVKFQ